MTQQRTGVVIVRVWIEEPTGQLRAHVTEKLDLEREDLHSTPVSTAADAESIVHGFLESFARGEGRHPGRQP
jgi:hypothetical protein